jgi:hypothetical protein
MGNVPQLGVLRKIGFSQVASPCATVDHHVDMPPLPEAVRDTLKEEKPVFPIKPCRAGSFRLMVPQNSLATQPFIVEAPEVVGLADRIAELVKTLADVSGQVLVAFHGSPPRS